MRTKTIVILSAAALLFGTAAFAQQMKHQGMGQGMMGQGMTGQGMMGQGMTGQGMMGQGMMGQGGDMSEMMSRMGEMMSHMGKMMGQMEQGAMMNMGEPKGDQGPSSKAFAEANGKMHGAMNIEYSGNADIDFARGMVPHHQGAIDMAKIVIQYGKDPEIRKLAEAIVTAQESEIALMNGWLAKSAK